VFLSVCHGGYSSLFHDHAGELRERLVVPGGGGVRSLLRRPQVVHEGQFVTAEARLPSILEAALDVFVEVVARLVAGRVGRRHERPREAVPRHGEHIARLVVQFGKGLRLPGEV